MNGIVDDELRALIDVVVSANRNGNRQTVSVWIDTAFNGGLVIPNERIASLGLRQSSTTEAILADGHLVELPTYSCFLDWFGQTYRTQVVANDGEFPLLGTTLLASRMLTIDYGRRVLMLD